MGTLIWPPDTCKKKVECHCAHSWSRCWGDRQVHWPGSRVNFVSSRQSLSQKRRWVALAAEKWQLGVISDLYRCAVCTQAKIAHNIFIKRLSSETLRVLYQFIFQLCLKKSWNHLKRRRILCNHSLIQLVIRKPPLRKYTYWPLRSLVDTPERIFLYGQKRLKKQSYC